jgi:hypothetical protein
VGGKKQYAHEQDLLDQVNVNKPADKHKDLLRADKHALVFVLLNLIAADPPLLVWQQQLFLETLGAFARLPNKASRFRLLFLAAGGSLRSLRSTSP